MTNCRHCGAPADRDQRHCGYCNSRVEQDLHGALAYGTAQPTEDRHCPDCDKPLETVNIKSDSTFYIERCVDCHGLFFDPGELEALMESSVTNVHHADKEKLAKIHAEKYVSQKGFKYRKCPVCKVIMNRKNFAAQAGVVIDECRQHGYWLDAGELQHLMEWRKAGGHIVAEEKDRQRQKMESLKNEETLRKMERKKQSMNYEYRSGRFDSRHRHNQSSGDLVGMLLDSFLS